MYCDVATRLTKIIWLISALMQNLVAITPRLPPLIVLRVAGVTLVATKNTLKIFTNDFHWIEKAIGSLVKCFFPSRKTHPFW